MKQRLVKIIVGGSLGYIMLNKYGKEQIHSVAVRITRGALGVSYQVAGARSKISHNWNNMVEEARDEMKSGSSRRKSILSNSLDNLGNEMGDRTIDLMYRSAEVLENAAFKLESKQKAYVNNQEKPFGKQP